MGFLSNISKNKQGLNFLIANGTFKKFAEEQLKQIEKNETQKNQKNETQKQISKEQEQKQTAINKQVTNNNLQTLTLFNSKNQQAKTNQTQTTQAKTVQTKTTQTQATQAQATQAKNITFDSSLGINGQIDGYVKQGSANDCYLISTLLSLSKTSKGKEIIKNSITPNADGSVTVTFAGAGKSYKITKDEILNKDPDKYKGQKYSSGDNDMLAFELAYEKYRGGNLASGNSTEVYNALIPNAKTSEIFHGRYNTLSASEVKSELTKKLNNQNVSLTFSVFGNENSTRKHIATCTNSYQYWINMAADEGHMLSITNVTSNKVTFVNPCNSTNEPVTMSWDEFTKFGIGCIWDTETK